MNTISIHQNFKKYFIYAFLTKVIFFLFFAYLFNKGASKEDNVNFIFTYSKDCASYIAPAINFVDHGTCYEESRGKKLFAHKMPGMVPIFVPLYYFFGLEWGLTFLVIIQIIIDALCCVLLAEIAYKIFNSQKAYLISFWLYAFSTIVSVSSHFAVSELLCTSFSIIAIYFALVKKGLKHIVLAGLFSTWSVFFRPTSILLFLIIPLIIMFKENVKLSWLNVKVKKNILILFFIPFIIFESLWIMRNHQILNRFIPADIGQENFGNPAMKSLFSLILAMGGDLQSWNPNSEMRWFNSPSSVNYDLHFANSNPFPFYVLKNGISLERLKKIRSIYFNYADINLSAVKRNNLEKHIDLLCKQSILDFKNKAPIYYYIISPLRNLKTFLFIKRPYGFSFRNNGFLEKSIRMWHFACYYFVLIFFIMNLLFIYLIKNKMTLNILLLCVMHIFLYGFIFRYSENRYLVPIYPYFVILATGNILYLFLNFKLKRLVV